MYLTSWEEDNLYYDEKDNLNKSMLKNTWKGYLFPSKYKNKSVTFTKGGMQLAEELIKKYLK